MKKNITINMCGRLYQIDEDACNLLQKYIESLRSSFGRQEGGDEIVDDIEARIAELFDELKKDGIEAITIDDVKAIITRIGEPEQLAGEEEKENAGEETRSAGQKMYDNFRSRTAGKRLFRNPKDKMIAGVLSGLAAYTNTDAVIWRIIAVILFFFYGAGLIAYIVLAIVVPVAVTEEDFRQMHGEGTPQYESSRPRTSNRKLFRNPNDKMVAGVLSGLAAYTNTDVIIWRILAIVFTFFYGIGLIAYIVLAIILPEAITPEEKLQMRGREVNPQNLADAVTDKEPVRHHGLLASLFSVLLKIAIIFAVGIAVIIGIALCVVFLAVLVVLVAAISLPVDGDMACTLQSMGFAEVWHDNPIVLYAFLVSLLALLLIPIYSIIHMLLSFGGKVKAMGVVQRIVFIVLWIASLCCFVPCCIYIVHTHNSKYTVVIRDDYVEESIKQCGNDNDDNLAYVDQHNVFELKDSVAYRSLYFDSVEPGVYRFTCKARSLGKGVCVFVMNNDGTRWQKEIPVTANAENSPKAAKNKKRAADSAKNTEEWADVVIDSISVTESGRMAYGVCLGENHTGIKCDGLDYSVKDFRLERIGD